MGQIMPSVTVITRLNYSGRRERGDASSEPGTRDRSRSRSAPGLKENIWGRVKRLREFTPETRAGGAVSALAYATKLRYGGACPRNQAKLNKNRSPVNYRAS